MARSTSLLATLLLAVMVGLLPAGEVEFRCETDIFVGTEKAPAQESLTLFTKNLAYDFLRTAPEETTVYDFGRGQFTLLDSQRKVKTTIASDDLLRFTAAYKTIKPESDLFAFCTQPSFDEAYSDETLKLTSKSLNYTVICTTPKEQGVDKRYRDFTDWSARLNAMRPGNLPPFPRMELNKALAARNLLPTEIERTISTSHLTGKRTESIRSHHLFNWSLSDSDRRRIDKVGDQLAQFTAVEPETYLRVDESKGKTAAK